ncbi:MAG TPA: hypothetical protein PK018_10720 [Candidatus Competibacter sp.]|nr:hypothetical protein [Candidatus Competibacteraceae bacterium]HPE72619.1 hypothetical protein [Candidatus Competibacter sp.]
MATLYPAFIRHRATVAERFGEGWTGAMMTDVIGFMVATGKLPNRYLVWDADGCWYDADEDGCAVLAIVGSDNHDCQTPASG